MLPFTAFSVLYYCFLYIYLPETKNKSIKEIAAVFENNESTGFVELASKKQGHYKTMDTE